MSSSSSVVDDGDDRDEEDEGPRRRRGMRCCPPGRCGRPRSGRTHSRATTLCDGSLPLPWRLTWFMLLLSMLAVAAALIFYLIYDYMSSGVRLELRRIPGRDLDFPIISFHVANQIRKSFLRTVSITPGSPDHEAFYSDFHLGHPGRFDNAFLKSIMSTKLKLINKAVFQDYQFYPDAAHPCSQVLLGIQAGNEDIETSPEVTTVVAEDAFGCRVNASEAFGRLRLGGRRKVTLVLDVEQFDHQELEEYPDKASSGVDLIFSDGNGKPALNLGALRIHPGFITNVVLKPEVSSAEYSSVSHFSPRDRGCVTANELVPPSDDYSTKYRSDFTSCAYRSVLQEILTNCHCIPKFVDFEIDSEFARCHGQGLHCANLALAHLGDGNINGENDTSPCLPLCNKVDYLPSVVSEPLPSIDRFTRGETFCLVVDKLRTLCANDKTAPLLEERQPDNLCPLFKIVDSFGQLCTKRSAGSSPPGLEALDRFKEEVFAYAQASLAVVHLELREETVTEYRTVGEQSIICLLVKIGLVLCIVLGFNLFGFLEGFLLLFGCGCLKRE